jgi:hypothetical protein
MEAITIQSRKSVSLEAGTSMGIKAASTAWLEGTMTLDLRGGLIRHNGGSKPLATVGSQVQAPTGQPVGQVTTGSQTVLGN